MNNNTLKVTGLTKIYPGTVALDNFSVEFEPGKVHAIIGKNGSGKSTLIKILAGAVKQTEGTVELAGDELKFKSPLDAFQKGIATVYQEMSLVPELTVAENIYFGRMPEKHGIISWKQAYKDAGVLLKGMGLDIPPHKLVSELAVWEQQTIEIAKAMSFGPKVLLLDEPTSALSQHEVEMLFRVIRELKKKNDVIILFISHKLQDLDAISDTITVIRDGKYIGRMETKEATPKSIVKMMFGEVEIMQRPDDLEYSNEIVLEVKNLTREPYFRNISFELKKGEILGIAGMLGSGRTELLRAIFGADPYDSGTIIIEGKEVTKMTPEKAKNYGLALTPEDRKKNGLIQMHSVKENIVLASLGRISKRGVISKKLENEFAQRQVDELQIKLPSLKSAVSLLSGGNQQKVIVGNWLNNQPKVLFLDEPSRGIDVNAKQQIFRVVWNQSRKGISTIMVSSELEEIIEVCHKILIMRHGEIKGEFSDKETIDDLYARCMGE